MLYRTSLSAPVFGLRREIDRLFEDTFGRGDAMSAWTPAVDVSENEKELRLEIELPGINPNDVELTAENGVLTIRGEKRSERKEGDEESRYHMVERSYGHSSFRRDWIRPRSRLTTRTEFFPFRFPKPPFRSRIEFRSAARSRIRFRTAATETRPNR